MTVGAGSGLAAAAAAAGGVLAAPRGSRGAARHRGGQAAAPRRPDERLGASGSGRSSGSVLQSTELNTDVAWRRPLESGSAWTCGARLEKMQRRCLTSCSAAAN